MNRYHPARVETYRWLLTGLLCLLLSACRQPASQTTVSGTIETDEAHVASRYGGRVVRIFEREGANLTNGQPIVELEAPELMASKAEAEAQLAELEAGARPQEKAAAKSEWEAQVADWELAKADLARAKALFEQKTISASERDRLVSRAAALDKSVAAAQSRYELLLAGTRPERIAQIKAKIEEIKSHLSELKVLAPTNAVLEVLSVKNGDVLSPNREVATLLLTQHLWVRVYVPETWLGFIKVNQPVTAHVDSFPEKEFKGRVEQISRAAEFTPRNTQTVAERIKQVFAVKIDLDNSEDKLRAGMAADVFFREVPRPPKP
ncbi:MAG TPA: efflux RND transporter periplasmic adaptor subunit [Candidatus Saccharimonadales bacterium]|nr:efflux RND transporter periplasmic adaptor subunit [Candidatus Saccharimonadales bacterium]